MAEQQKLAVGSHSHGLLKAPRSVTFAEPVISSPEAEMQGQSAALQADNARLQVSGLVTSTTARLILA